MTVEIIEEAHDDAPATTSKETDSKRALFQRTVTINRPKAELYAFWRDFSNLSKFMEYVEAVTVQNATRSHWTVSAPAGKSVEWDAIVTEDRPNELIAWKSAEGADVANSGQVRFADASGGRGTTVTAIIAYDPPGGTIGKIVAKLFQQEPAIQARRDLRRFKQLMETGEIAVSHPEKVAKGGIQ